jgi:hypothetical protein
MRLLRGCWAVAVGAEKKKKKIRGITTGTIQIVDRKNVEF